MIRSPDLRRTQSNTNYQLLGMKFIVSSSQLLKQLQILGGVINTNNTLPILDNFLFELSNNELRISASDLETTMSTSLEVEADESGAIAVPARLLLDILKTFAEQPLTFKVEDNHTIEFDWDADSATVRGDGYTREIELSSGVLDRGSLQQGGFADAEDRRVGADPGGQRRDGHDREPRLPHQESKGEGDIGEEGIHVEMEYHTPHQ